MTFSRLDWCDPGVWRCQLKTCWGCYCCWCWCWGSCTMISGYEMWSRFVFELLIWPQKLLWQDELNSRVRCAFGNVFVFRVAANDITIKSDHVPLKAIETQIESSLSQSRWRTRCIFVWVPLIQRNQLNVHHNLWFTIQLWLWVHHNNTGHTMCASQWYTSHYVRITASDQTTIIASLQAWVLPYAFLKVTNV